MAADPFIAVPSTRRIASGGAEGLVETGGILGPLTLPLGMNGFDSMTAGAFQGDTLHAGYQSTASGANSVAAAIATGLVGGQILLDPGDANSGRSDLSLGLHYQGQLMCTHWCKFRVGVTTNYKIEHGFTDVISGTDAGAVNSKSGNTFNADDFVGIVVDTSDDAIPALMGVAAQVVGTKTPFTGVTSLTAATFYWFGVSVRGTMAKGIILDADAKLIDQTAWVTGMVTATTLLTPWAFIQNRSGAQHTMHIQRMKSYEHDTTASGA